LKIKGLGENKIIEDNIRNSREIIFTPVLNGYDFSQANIYNMFNSRTNVFTLENKLLSKLNKIIKAAIDYMLVVCSIFFWGGATPRLRIDGRLGWVGKPDKTLE